DYSVDVCAPGSNIYSTVYNNSYVAYSGTSMASPVAAGGVGLIRSKFPNMTALQAAQQLRVTCDNIYNLTGNTAYRDKLGKGRINLYRAVRDSVTPGVIVERLVSSDRNDNVFVAGDTLYFTVMLRNLLRPTTNLNCTLSTSSTNVTLIPATFNVGVLATNDTISNFSLPFRAIINPGTPLNTEVAFKVTTYDGSYSDFFAFKVVVNVDYINIEVNDVGTSITSKGLIGYNESGQVQGIGFTYQGGPTILYEMGLMVGAAGPQVSDNVRGAGGTYDSDFSSVVTVTGQRPGTVSSYDAYGQFSDNSSAAPLSVLITHRAYAWDSPAADRKYIIVEYVIRNTGTSALNGLYGGIFADWDIPLYSNNFASEDLGRRMGYCWSTDAGGLYAGIKLLTQTPFNHYAIDNSTGGNGGADLSDGFDNSEKYFVLSNSRSDAGNTAPTGNDVIDVVSTGPFNLTAGDSVKIAFALIAGENLTMIQDAADASQIRYDNSFPTAIQPVNLASATALQSVYPNPASTSGNIEFTLDHTAKVSIAVYSMTGELVLDLLNQQVQSGRHTLHADLSSIPAGNYLVRFVSDDVKQVRPLSIVR
ncbi:MAG: S8 family serine peptidase, partial [Bacteroidota bacterium]